jgi:hypothetical protein
MAKPKELVAKVSEITGVSLATVVVHDRNLLNAGLRTEGLRGRGRSKVTFRDAANLLIAVAASRNVKDSAETVRAYAPLAADKEMSFGDEQRGETFGDALASLIEAIPADRGAFSGPDGDEVIVSLSGPRAFAKIEIHRRGQDALMFEYAPTWLPGAPIQSAGDLEYVSRFTQVTLGYVGEVVLK